MGQARFDSLVHTGLDLIGNYFWALDHAVPRDYLQEYILAAKSKNFSLLQRISELLLADIPFVPRSFVTPQTLKTLKKSPDKSFFMELSAVLDRYEALTLREFGSKESPLLLTIEDSFGNQIRNLGCSLDNLPGLVHFFGKTKAYLLFVDMLESYANIVANTALNFREMFYIAWNRETGEDNIGQLSEEKFSEYIYKFQEAINQHAHRRFPQRIEVQFIEALRGISNMSPGTNKEVFITANIESTVFGKSSEGLAFSRHPFSGEPVVYGTYIAGVNQRKSPLTKQQQLIDQESVSLEEFSPDSLSQIKNALPKAVRLLGYDVEAEFVTGVDGLVYYLSFHRAELTPLASIKSTLTMYTEGLLSPTEAASRIDPKDIELLLHDRLSDTSRQTLQSVGSSGLSVSPGTVMGHVFYDIHEAMDWHKNAKSKGKDPHVILVTDELLIKDSAGLDILSGLITRKGGTSSHAAVFARANGIPCIVGFQGIKIDFDRRMIQINGKDIEPGCYMTMEAAEEGRLYYGKGELANIADQQTVVKLTAKLFSRVLQEHQSPLEVRVNINKAKDVEVGLLFGAAGVGLCRTENMLLQPDALQHIRRVILLDEPNHYQESLKQLEEIQQKGFRDIFLALNGREANIRLMDMPLHEIMPTSDEEIHQLWMTLQDVAEISQADIKSKVLNLHESNPMLGLRACRFGIVKPEIYDMQIRAILRAAYEVENSGIRVEPGIMFPLVSNDKELARMRARVYELDEELRVKEKISYKHRLQLRVGTMVELPSAAVLSDKLAPLSDFIAFGTNDLTQTTLGISRDDCMQYLPLYLDHGLLPHSPFERLNPAVKDLMETSVHKGRFVRRDTKFGICGEQGADPETIQFCLDHEINYLSCSPYRVLPLRAELVHRTLRKQGIGSNM